MQKKRNAKNPKFEESRGQVCKERSATRKNCESIQRDFRILPIFRNFTSSSRGDTHPLKIRKRSIKTTRWRVAFSLVYSKYKYDNYLWLIVLFDNLQGESFLSSCALSMIFLKILRISSFDLLPVDWSRSGLWSSPIKKCLSLYSNYKNYLSKMIFLSYCRQKYDDAMGLFFYFTIFFIRKNEVYSSCSLLGRGFDKGPELIRADQKSDPICDLYK